MIEVQYFGISLATVNARMLGEVIVYPLPSLQSVPDIVPPDPCHMPFMVFGVLGEPLPHVVAVISLPGFRVLERHNFVT